jgi:hypothetical protein
MSFETSGYSRPSGGRRAAPGRYRFAGYPARALYALVKYYSVLSPVRLSNWAPAAQLAADGVLGACEVFAALDTNPGRWGQNGGVVGVGVGHVQYRVYGEG